MLLLIVCWFLFALPAYSCLMMVLGAWLYAMGVSGQTPSLALPRFMPRFSFGTRPGKNGNQRERELLPDV